MMCVEQEKRPKIKSLRHRKNNLSSRKWSSLEYISNILCFLEMSIVLLVWNKLLLNHYTSRRWTRFKQFLNSIIHNCKIKMLISKSGKFWFDARGSDFGQVSLETGDESQSLSLHSFLCWEDSVGLMQKGLVTCKQMLTAHECH